MRVTVSKSAPLAVGGELFYSPLFILDQRPRRFRGHKKHANRTGPPYSPRKLWPAGLVGRDRGTRCVATSASHEGTRDAQDVAQPKGRLAPADRTRCHQADADVPQARRLVYARIQLRCDLAQPRDP